MLSISSFTEKKNVRDIEEMAERLFYESFPDFSWEKASPWKREIFRQTAKAKVKENTQITKGERLNE